MPGTRTGRSPNLHPNLFESSRDSVDNVKEITTQRPARAPTDTFVSIVASAKAEQRSQPPLGGVWTSGSRVTPAKWLTSGVLVPSLLGSLSRLNAARIAVFAIFSRPPRRECDYPCGCMHTRTHVCHGPVMSRGERRRITSTRGYIHLWLAPRRDNNMRGKTGKKERCKTCGAGLTAGYTWCRRSLRCDLARSSRRVSPSRQHATDVRAAMAVLQLDRAS